MSEDETEQAIASYRHDLETRAELAERDLDEIEDHLRSLTQDLRERGMPAAEAVTEAARRLGDPRTVAREQSRVRTAFGTRLSRARAWSYFVLAVPWTVLQVYYFLPYTGVWSRFFFNGIISVGIAVLLVRGVSWARPLKLGAACYGVGGLLLQAVYLPHGLDTMWMIVALSDLAALAFLMPWRRHELTPAGAAVALAAWSYGAASGILGYEMTIGATTTTFSDFVTSPFSSCALVACITAALALLGTVLRARWSAISFVATAALLGISVFEVAMIELDDGTTYTMYALGLAWLCSSVLASLAGAVLIRRSARSMLGSLRSVAG